MKVLFVGNSHTYFNDMPELFARFAEQTTGVKPEITMLAYSGRDLDWHRQEYFSLRFNLLYGGYDFCVIQQAAHPYPPIEKTLHTGGEIIEMCRKCGVTPVVYMTWAEKRFPENQQKMIDTCKKLAGEYQAVLLPVGAVWQRVQAECPDIELYYKDGEHAGVYGDFLIAALLVRTLCGKVSASISGEGSDFLRDQTIAWERPSLSLEKDMIRVQTDKDRTDRILRILNEYMDEKI